MLLPLVKPDNDFSNGERLWCIETHTSGQPTRIVYGGWPSMAGTLVEQRQQAVTKYDYLRRRLILEPRGHWEMYGAALRPVTELTESGEADIGVLFMHNQGFSMMCGHATLALGRFIVDYREDILPPGKQLQYNAHDHTVTVRLHVPAGIVPITVPVDPKTHKTDLKRTIAFNSVPSYASGHGIEVTVGSSHRWPELGDREKVHIDFSFGGVFYGIVTPKELGFEEPLQRSEALISRMKFAAARLKEWVNSQSTLQQYIKRPADESGQIYSILYVEQGQEEDLGLCVFADGQIDRSPTGGGVAARVALAHSKGHMRVGDSHRYQSLLTRDHAGMGSFCGTVDAEVQSEGHQAVIVRVEGTALYTGLHVLVCEPEDVVAKEGFSLFTSR